MTLKISLKPHERLVVNGAVLENTDRRAYLLIRNNVSLLRESDIVYREDIHNTSTELYYAIMRLYIQDISYANFAVDFARLFPRLVEEHPKKDDEDLCRQLSHHMQGKEYYRALTCCKKLSSFKLEKKRPSNELK